MTFVLGEEGVGHAQKHGKPTEMQQDEGGQEGQKEGQIGQVEGRGQNAIGQHVKGFRIDGVDNGKGQEDESGDHPDQTHGDKADNGGGLGLDKVGQFGGINGNVTEIVYPKDHAANAGETAHAAHENEGIGDDVMKEHFGKVSPVRWTPANDQVESPQCVSPGMMCYCRVFIVLKPD